MDKTYSPHSIEHACYNAWETEGYFEPQGSGEPFCIMLPPPNVTGSLHMGHGFQHTLIDILVRYQRMLGRPTLWQPGTDHAGISTQLVVEGQLAAQGLSRKDMTREEFLNRVWQWKEESGGQITRQMRRIGSSVAWSKERFTMDPGFSAAVQKVFIQLHDEGLIYRGNRLVNWDPVLGTAISDLEVLSSEEAGHMWHIRYPLVDGDESIIVATTRPETLLGDSAVAVHPDDVRYQHLIGRQLHLPLCQRHIPIIGDASVDPEFGTGCVKITPAHDFNDYEVGKRHQLAIINILTKQATLNDNAPAAYRGLDRMDARTQIIADLTAQGFLVDCVAHTLKIPRGEKSNAIIEPLLTEQWYVNIKPLAKPALDAVEQGKIAFTPENWTKTYAQWMENIEDWCISRQLWWGHRIPAWYDDAGKAYVGYSENDVRFKYQLSDTLRLVQDEDVLDTWFSSALWPFVTLGWPNRTDALEQFYPTSVLFTGFDILFFWVARMVMLGLKFTGEVPFHHVVITGLICDQDGKKMSKSKGNVLDPIDIIDGIALDDLIKKRTSNLMLTSVKQHITEATRSQFPDGIRAYGADALRFTFCSMAANTRIVRFDMARVEGYRNFCNKLWNAARFVLAQLDEETIDLGDGAFQYAPADEWILSRLNTVIIACHQHIADYRFDLLANALYDFVWHEYCDWYLELSKTVLYDDQALRAKKRGTRHTLITVLDHVVRLLHPIIPFITESIWQRLSKLTHDEGASLMLSAYPQATPAWEKPIIEAEMDWLKAVIQAVRTIRSEMNITPSKRIPLLIRQPSIETSMRLEKYQFILINLAKLGGIQLLVDTDQVPVCASAMVDELELLIPMADLIDKQAELARLDKELRKIDEDIRRTEGKLTNPAFIDKAPVEVVQKEQEKLAQAKLIREHHLHHQEKIAAL
jgi:valyl-tRNA synthetase